MCRGCRHGLRNTVTYLLQVFSVKELIVDGMSTVCVLIVGKDADSGQDVYCVRVDRWQGC